MEVTGENKKQFEDWWRLFGKDKEDLIVTAFETNKKSVIGISYFYNQPFEMQIGVYLAYYDSLGIIVDTLKTDYDRKHHYQVLKEDTEIEYNGKDFTTRNEAYREAFKKANKIVNNK